MTLRTVSTIIPVRNQPDTLDELLGALERLTVPAGWQLEVVVVDNNSTDHTADVIKRHDATYILETRLGPSVARNAGVEASVGELLWFIDADAVPLGQDFLERLIATADELGDFGGFGGPILLPYKQRNNPVAFADHMACWSAWPADRPLGESGFQPTSWVTRRSLFEAAGGYDTDLRVLEDKDLQERIERSRRVEEGDDAPLRPIWFVPALPVAHSARSSLVRTVKHSWYWGLPSREAWLQQSGMSVAALERPYRRWLSLPRLFLSRAAHPVRTGWRVSRWRTLASLPFLSLTLLVWSVAVIVGKGQPEDGRMAPV